MDWPSVPDVITLLHKLYLYLQDQLEKKVVHIMTVKTTKRSDSENNQEE